MGVRRICTIGAGALGGYMSGRLALAGFEVTVIDRGAHFERIRHSGLKVIEADGVESVVPVKTVDDARAAGPHDLVLLGVKAHQIEQVAPDLPHVFDDETIVMTIQNGIPWWYFQNHGGPLDNRRLQALDPRGIIEKHVPTRRIIGCIAYPAAVSPDPGVVQVISPGKFPVGEPDGSISSRLEDLSRVLELAGLRSRLLNDVRAEIWLKALGSVSFNPISALTRSTMVEMCTDPDTRLLVQRVMEEAQVIANRLGIEFRRTIEERIEGGRAVGEHRTSMLQDVENGDRLEVDALVGSIAELGRITDTPTPMIDAIYALTKQLDATLESRTDPAR